MAEEQTFFDEQEVKVTNSRVLVKGDMYSLAQVTSCKTRYTAHVGVDKGKRTRKRLLAWGGIVLGVIIGAAAHSFLVGALIVVAGIIGSAMTKDTFDYKTFHVSLGSSSGEKEAVSSVDEAFINRVASAINEAIVARG